MFFKSNFRSQGQIEVSDKEAHLLIPKDKCIVFVRRGSNPKWLRCSGATKYVATPREFLDEPYLLVDDHVMIRPIPPPKEWPE